jgi:signal transduction histidine kinase
LRNLSRSREEESRRRIVEERLRIARDLHDSVAHGLATINVQAAAAGHVLAKRPEAAASALSIIEQNSATVLDELATMLTVLREPGPGLESLDRLAANARAAGLTVSLTVTGPIRAIPHGPATAAYRIVQESLTNVIRHASATAAHVTVRAGPDHALHLEIRDNGPRGAPPPKAHSPATTPSRRQPPASTSAARHRPTRARALTPPGRPSWARALTPSRRPSWARALTP